MASEKISVRVSQEQISCQRLVRERVLVQTELKKMHFRVADQPFISTRARSPSVDRYLHGKHLPMATERGDARFVMFMVPM